MMKSKSRRYRKASISDSEIMTILIVFSLVRSAISKNTTVLHQAAPEVRFPQCRILQPIRGTRAACFFQMIFTFLTSPPSDAGIQGIGFTVDSTMVPVCHNLRRYANKVFKVPATDRGGTMGWCHGFKLHLSLQRQSEIITFCFTGANVDDRDPKVWAVL